MTLSSPPPAIGYMRRCGWRSRCICCGSCSACMAAARLLTVLRCFAIGGVYPLLVSLVVMYAVLAGISA